MKYLRQFRIPIRFITILHVFPRAGMARMCVMFFPRADVARMSVQCPQGHALDSVR